MISILDSIRVYGQYTYICNRQQKELNVETAKYLADLRCTRIEEKKRDAEVNKAIQEDMDREIEKQLNIEKARAAASRRLLCDVTEAQKFQRLEKCQYIVFHASFSFHLFKSYNKHEYRQYCCYNKQFFSQ